MISLAYAAQKRRRTHLFTLRAFFACLEWILQTLVTRPYLSHNGSRRLEGFFDLQSGSFTLEHTESRRSELVETLQELIGRGSATPKELERLHGRLIWFGSFVYGRMLNRLVKEVSNKARARGKTGHL